MYICLHVCLQLLFQKEEFLMPKSLQLRRAETIQLLPRIQTNLRKLKAKVTKYTQKKKDKLHERVSRLRKKNHLKNLHKPTPK